MSATISPSTAPITAGASWTHSARLALVALAVVVLLAVSFVVGRATVSSSPSAPATSPATTTAPFIGEPSTPADCHLGRAC